MSTAAEIAAALTAPILLPVALTKAREAVGLSRGPGLVAAEAALVATQARWDAEAPARAVREEAKRLGFTRSQYDANVYVAKVAGRWVKHTPAQVADAIVKARA